MTESELKHNIEDLNKSIMTGVKGPLGFAWSSYYQYGDTAALGTPRSYGIIAIKKELVYNGYGLNLVVDMPTFGDAMRNRVKEFQSHFAVTADGVVGPRTARQLFKARIFDRELNSGIPDHLVFKLIDLESGFDPGATGSVDPHDRGLGQINSVAHPDVSDAEAFNPSFSIPWICDALKNNIVYEGDEDAGLAAYNVGRYYAKKWLEAGKPASGLFTSGGKDYAQICTTYVNLVKSRLV